MPGMNRLGVSDVVTVPAQSFEAARRRAGWNDNGIALFPQLWIYNPQGQLIYSSYDNAKSAQVISQFPDDMAGRSPIATTSSLASVLQAIPEFQRHQSEILEHPNYAIISVSMDGCHGCSILDGVLSARQSKLQSDGINLLTLQVVHR